MSENYTENGLKKDIMESGKTYRFTVEMKFRASDSVHYWFIDDAEDTVIVNQKKVSNVELVNTHEVQRGDIYLRGGAVYQVDNDRDPFGLAGLFAYRAGDSGFYHVDKMGFTEEELVYREGA